MTSVSSNLSLRLAQRILLAGLAPLTVVMAVGVAPGLTRAQAQDGKPASKPLKLVKLVVTGNKQVSSEAIAQGEIVKVGDKVSKQDLQSNLDAILAVYRRANVGASFKAKMVIAHPGMVSVTYMITEEAPQPAQAPAVLRDDKVTFEGNKQISSDAIAAVITIKPGDKVDQANVVASMQAIVALYKKAGIGTKITPSATYPQPDHVVVDYKIEEQATN